MILARLNQSLNSCVNITLANHIDKNQGKILNTTDQFISLYNLSISNSTGIYLWGDFANCNVTAFRYFRPLILFNSICDKCGITDYEKLLKCQ